MLEQTKLKILINFISQFAVKYKFAMTDGSRKKSRKQVRTSVSLNMLNLAIFHIFECI